MIDERDDQDPGLTRMLRAVRADADPALWTRVRARIETRRPVPALLAWAMRPAALAASVALLVASAALALMLAPRETASTVDDYATLADALVGERDAELMAPETGPVPVDDVPRDSGSGM